MPLLPTPNWPTVTVLLYTSLSLSLSSLSGQNLEDVLATLQVEEDGDILTEDELLLLEELVRDPIDFNTVNKKQIEEIPLFNSTDASIILQKRKDSGFFISTREISNLPGLTVIAGELLPLIAALKEKPPANMTLRNRWLNKEKDARILTQGKISKSNMDGGFTIERDPGETSLTDFVSGYLATTLTGGTRLIFGDFQLQAGYGLLFSRSIPPLKGYSSITGMGKPGKGLKPYRSSIEYWALRGIALEKTGRFGQWTLSISSSPKDATIESNQVVSISTSGLHRSLSSLAKKHNLQEDIVLFSWQQNQTRNSNLGILLASDRWTVHGSSPDNRAPKSYGTLFGHYKWNDFLLFGEIATHSSIQPSCIGGIIITERNLKWISSFRYYTAGFQGPRSQPFREWSSPVLNETGVYQGVSIKLGKHRFNSYGDIYRQASADEVSGRAIRGFEIANTWSYRGRGKQVSFRWKLEEKSDEDWVVFSGDPFNGKTRRESWRLNTSLSPGKQLRIQLQGNRTFVSSDNVSYRGNGVSLKAHLNRDPYRLSLHWVGFNTDDYVSRIYVWDLNFPGELGNKTFFPTGQSVAGLLRIKTETGAAVSVRIRTTWKFVRSGEYWSKPNNEIGVQMDIAF